MVVAERYRLEERLGQGGTGEVWRAYDTTLERPVAIKLLHPWVASDDAARERFRREATVMARLRHPNIVAILDFADDAERPFLVQEYCAGGTLRSLAGAAPLPWDRVRAIARPIADALAHAHVHGVIHRDLKPSNVLFGTAGRILVADFGLARILAGDDGTLTATGTRMGSPEYWSPEQAAGDPVSERADVYSLGCILFQLATGRIPFEGDDRLAAGYRRVHEAPPRAASVRPDVPADGSDLIGLMMRRDPASRPRAEDVVAALDGGRPVNATIAARPPDQPTEHLVAPTIRVAPPTPPPAPEPDGPARGSAVVAPAPPPRPGVRLGTSVFALFLGAAGAGVAVVADAGARHVAIDRTGLRFSGGLPAAEATAALAIVAGTAALTLSLLILAVWAARSSSRARWRPVRGLLGILAVLSAGLASGGLVWTAHAAAAGHLDVLWNRALS